MRFWKRIATTIVATLLTTGPAAAQGPRIDRELFSRGMDVYIEHCAVCHGEDGDGKGPLASGFSPRPRDLTRAAFKFRSTEPGEFPLKSDLVKTIRNGVFGTFGQTMPSFGHLSDEDLDALTEVVRIAAGAPDFGTPVVPPPRPANADLNLGKTLYNKLNCIGCHGEAGDGRGVQAPRLVDSDGLSIPPADLRAGAFKGGNQPEDIWMRLYTGVDGTPMPSFGRNTSGEELWAIVEYVLTFSEIGS